MSASSSGRFSWTQRREVTAVVEQQVRALPVGPQQGLVDGPPVLLLGLALPGEHRGAGGGDGRGGLVLGREDVARRPADLGAEGLEGLDEHGGLHGHVEAAGDAGTGERLLTGVPLAQRHEAGHLALGEADLLAAPLGEARCRGSRSPRRGSDG